VDARLLRHPRLRLRTLLFLLRRGKPRGKHTLLLLLLLLLLGGRGELGEGGEVEVGVCADAGRGLVLLWWGRHTAAYRLRAIVGRAAG